MQTTISRWRHKLGTDAGTPWLSRACRQERCDIYLAYDGVQKFNPVGFIVTAKGNADALIAYCPLECGEDVPDKVFVAELMRQLKIAVCLAERPETAPERDDVVWLGWVGSDDRPVPQWIYGLKCSPLSYEWDGHFVQLRPFCPRLFEAMARQPRAVEWLRRNEQKKA